MPDAKAPMQTEVVSPGLVPPAYPVWKFSSQSNDTGCMSMFYRSAVLSLGLMVFSICGLAQMDPFSPPRLGPPNAHDQAMAHEIFNSLSGTVVSADNKPLENVHVELRAGNGSAVYSVYTNSSGTFEFQQVSSGTYDVVANSGIAQSQQRVDVNGMPSSILLRMPVRSTADDGNGKTSVSVSQFQVPEKARVALQKAREAAAKGKSEEAQKQLDKALETCPRYADALTFRGLLKMDANDLSGAVADLQEAINDDGSYGLAYIVMGAVLNVQSKYDDAIRVLERGQSLSPNSWQANFEMGKALMAKSQYEASLKQFDRAQTLLSNDVPVIHLAKARALLGLRNYADAATELQAFLAREPQGPRSEEAHKLLAQAQGHL
jgi:Tfp pilus assembly protein PilF